MFFKVYYNDTIEIVVFVVIVCIYSLQTKMSNPCVFATVPGISTGNSICM